IGAIGMLIKIPEFAHLYLIVVGLILAREGRKALLRPRYLIAAAVTMIAITAWSRYIDAVCAQSFVFGSSKEKFLIYVGTLQSRFHLVPWGMLGLYLTAFVFAGPASLGAAYGFWIFLR